MAGPELNPAVKKRLQGVVDYIEEGRKQGEVNPLTRGAGRIPLNKPDQPQGTMPAAPTSEASDKYMASDEYRWKKEEEAEQAREKARLVEYKDDIDYPKYWGNMTEDKMVKILQTDPKLASKLMNWVGTVQGRGYYKNIPRNLYYTYDEEGRTPASRITKGEKPVGKYLYETDKEWQARQDRLEAMRLAAAKSGNGK